MGEERGGGKVEDSRIEMYILLVHAPYCELLWCNVSSLVYHSEQTVATMARRLGTHLYAMQFICRMSFLASSVYIYTVYCSASGVFLFCSYVGKNS